MSFHVIFGIRGFFSRGNYYALLYKGSNYFSLKGFFPFSCFIGFEAILVYHKAVIVVLIAQQYVAVRQAVGEEIDVLLDYFE